MFITCGRPDGDLVERDPAFRVLLAVVLPELFELEVSWPYDLSKMRSELFEARGAVFGVVLDAGHVLVGLLISIAVTIVVVVMTTLTTILSALVIAATATTTVADTTMWGIGWRRIITSWQLGCSKAWDRRL
jgi:hypothetical protein